MKYSVKILNAIIDGPGFQNNRFGILFDMLVWDWDKCYLKNITNAQICLLPYNECTSPINSWQMMADEKNKRLVDGN